MLVSQSLYVGLHCPNYVLQNAALQLRERSEVVDFEDSDIDINFGSERLLNFL